MAFKINTVADSSLSPRQTKDTLHNISVILPVYNEEKNLENTLKQTIRTLETLKVDYEIIIIDDCSQDNTKLVVKELEHRYFNIRSVSHDNNLGIGGAFRTGIGLAGKEYVMLVPADNPLLPEDMSAYLPRIGPCDIIVGTRVERLGYSPFARFCSFAYNRIFIPLLFNLGLSDVNWIQIYRRNLFGEDGIKIEHTGIFFLVEILVKARQKRLIIAEVPARMKKRMYGRATCFRLKVIFQTFSNMLSFFWKTQISKGKI